MSIANKGMMINIFEDEIRDLIDSHASGNYLRVVILSQQLLVCIVDEISKVGSSIIDSIAGPLDDDFCMIAQMIEKLNRQDTSDKALIAGCLMGFYEEGFNQSKTPVKDFKKYFTKLEELVSLRNEIAHEFYKKNIPSSKMKRVSKNALELIEVFASHEYLTLEYRAEWLGST
ncbi:TPA: hypothetical protein P0E15_003386 [Vibrio harveyi]|nr:hypothetical protein [Vibrio harveyi]